VAGRLGKAVIEGTAEQPPTTHGSASLNTLLSRAVRYVGPNITREPQRQRQDDGFWIRPVPKAGKAWANALYALRGLLFDDLSDARRAAVPGRRGGGRGGRPWPDRSCWATVLAALGRPLVCEAWRQPFGPPACGRGRAPCPSVSVFQPKPVVVVPSRLDQPGRCGAWLAPARSTVPSRRPGALVITPFRVMLVLVSAIGCSRGPGLAVWARSLYNGLRCRLPNGVEQASGWLVRSRD